MSYKVILKMNTLSTFHISYHENLQLLHSLFTALLHLNMVIRDVIALSYVRGEEMAKTSHQTIRQADEEFDHEIAYKNYARSRLCARFSSVCDP